MSIFTCQQATSSICHSLNLSIEGIVYQLQQLIAITSLGGFHETKWSLHRLLTHYTAISCKVSTLFLDALYEVHSMVVTRQSKAWLCYHHWHMEPPAVVALQLQSTCRVGIIVESRRNVCIVLLETVEIVLGIHQPLCITEERHHGSWIFSIQFIQLVEHGCKLWRTSSIEYHHIAD